MTWDNISKRRPTTAKQFQIFGSKLYIKWNDENLGKFDSRSDEGAFLGYSTRSKAYKCYNLSLKMMVEIPYVKVDGEFKYIRIDDDDDQPRFE